MQTCPSCIFTEFSSSEVVFGLETVRSGNLSVLNRKRWDETMITVLRRTGADGEMTTRQPFTSW